MRSFQSAIRVASLLALTVFVLGYAPMAHAAFSPNMWMCMSDSASGCVAGADFVQIFADGTSTAVEKGGTSTVNLVGTSNSPTLKTTLDASIGAFTENISTGLVNATNTEVLDLSWNATSTGAGTLWVFWGATGFGGHGPFVGEANGNFSGAITSVTAGACIADTNTLGSANAGNPGTGGTALPVCGATGTEGNVSATGSSSPINLSFVTGTASTSPFSLEQTLKIVSTAGSGQTSGDFMLSSVPEPTSVVLLGGVLVLTFGAIRRKFHA